MFILYWSLYCCKASTAWDISLILTEISNRSSLSLDNFCLTAVLKFCKSSYSSLRNCKLFSVSGDEGPPSCPVLSNDSSSAALSGP